MAVSVAFGADRGIADAVGADIAAAEAELRRAEVGAELAVDPRRIARAIFGADPAARPTADRVGLGGRDGDHP
ncbi:MAG: hypothetical protein F9K41_06490, partial [Sphingopyxis terrae]